MQNYVPPTKQKWQRAVRVANVHQSHPKTPSRDVRYSFDFHTKPIDTGNIPGVVGEFSFSDE